MILEISNATKDFHFYFKRILPKRLITRGQRKTLKAGRKNGQSHVLSLSSVNWREAKTEPGMGCFWSPSSAESEELHKFRERLISR